MLGVSTATFVAFGGLAAILGVMTTASELGIVMGVATAVAMLALALYERSLPWLAVAAFGLLQAAPRAAIECFPGRLSASLTLIVVGSLLVGSAVWVARHQGEKNATRRIASVVVLHCSFRGCDRRSATALRLAAPGTKVPGGGRPSRPRIDAWQDVCRVGCRSPSR